MNKHNLPSDYKQKGFKIIKTRWFSICTKTWLEYLLNYAEVNKPETTKPGNRAYSDYKYLKDRLEKSFLGLVFYK
jgi:hypothetical protein